MEREEIDFTLEVRRLREAGLLPPVKRKKGEPDPDIPEEFAQEIERLIRLGKINR